MEGLGKVEKDANSEEKAAILSQWSPYIQAKISWEIYLAIIFLKFGQNFKFPFLNQWEK